MSICSSLNLELGLGNLKTQSGSSIMSCMAPAGPFVTDTISLWTDHIWEVVAKSDLDLPTNMNPHKINEFAWGLCVLRSG